MGNGLFVKLAKEIVEGYTVDELGYESSEVDIYVVWLSKTLQNNKALLSTDVEDGRYYEITYNGNKDEFYLAVYGKELNRVVTFGDIIRKEKEQ